MSNLSDAARKTAIKLSLIEVSNAWLQAESHKEHAKEVIAHIATEYEMDKSLVQKLANMHHKQTIQKVKDSNDELIEAYEEIFGETE